MDYAIGILLAVGVSTFGTVLGLDRERGFYTTILIVVGSYYVLFAAMGAPRQAMVLEIVVAVGFLLVAVLGYKINLWIVAGALIAHGIFDLSHHLFIANPGVPRWWPGFCLAYDGTAGAWLAVRLYTHAVVATPSKETRAVHSDK